ncbi:MAG: hypothetical protein KBS91_02600 [Firmicutes bacterium]|nr:hypothetical protein [Candidatus Caballimonas caccae]
MAQAQTFTAIANSPSRKLFRPMFRARWQNLQNIINDSGFIEMIPEPYLSYYMAYTQQSIQWSQGFVPMLHRQDFFSTGMGYTVCDIFVRECMSGGFRIVSQDQRTTDFMKAWAENEDFFGDLATTFWNTNAGGNSLFVLTPVNGNVYVTEYAKNRCFFTVGKRNKVTKATLLNRFVAGSEKAYYIKERRTMLDGKGYYKVEMGVGTLITSPTWQGGKLKEVPNEVKADFNNQYGDIKLNTWYELPEVFNGIGVWNCRNKSVSASMVDLAGYSDSSLQTALDILYSIDYNYTQAQVDMFLGKSRALVPKQFTPPQINMRGGVAYGQSFGEAMQDTPLDDVFYTQVETGTLDGKPIQPTLMQPDLRAEAHKYIRDSDLELLASKVGLSASTLANHLTNNNPKTATQSNIEQDATENSVETKRALITRDINEMLNVISAFYGYGEVEIEWGRAGKNSSEVNQQLLSEYQAGTLTLKQYLMKRWIDKTEKEIDEMVKENNDERKDGLDNLDLYEDSADTVEQTSINA